MSATKPIRLGRAAGELNIGMSTLVEFLAAKGVIVELTPNTKLTPEQYDLLKVEFEAEKEHRKNRNQVPRIFKLSIGPMAIESTMFGDLLAEKLVCVHNSTNPIASSKISQFEQFSQARNGDYFYLCRGNQEVVLFGIFSDDETFFSMKKGYEGWGLRRFRILANAVRNAGYNGQQKWWTPNHNSTFAEIPINEYSLADQLIFKPFFGRLIKEMLFGEVNYLDLNKGENGTSLTYLQESATKFSISDDVEGVIGVKEQAIELSNLLVDLKSDKGMMVGVFGRWGRGKTKLWSEIKAHIDEIDTPPFHYVEFHAWKYQDTSASWAYLYESITKSCIVETGNYRAFWSDLVSKLTFRINIQKYGWKPLIIFSLGFFIFITWTFFISFDTKLSLIEKLISLIISGALSIGMLFGIFRLYKRILPKAIDLFKKYSKIKSFKDHLGLQSEIQDELIQVLQAHEHFYPEKRILLFVDDIDRCSEERIIGIIDSLKVMLEDSYISKRVVVLTAVDERVLKRAIHRKYFDSIKNSFNEDETIKSITIETLIREYMDKLFISGIKLSEINLSEKNQILNAFCEGKVLFKEADEDIQNSPKESGPNTEETTTKLIEVQVPEIKDNLQEVREYLVDDPTKGGLIDFKIGDENHEIVELEYDRLKSCLNELMDATPRTIRIFYYRYLLAKRLLRHQMPNNSSMGIAWHLSHYKIVLPKLIAIYGSNKTLKDLSALIGEVNSSNESIFNLEIAGEVIPTNREILKQILKVVEMVITY